MKVFLTYLRMYLVLPTVKWIILIIVFFFHFTCWCQLNKNGFYKRKFEQLLHKPKSLSHDTAKINLMNSWAQELQYENPDSVILLTSQCIQLANIVLKSSDSKAMYDDVKKAKATTYGICGVAHYSMNRHAEALENYFKALKIDEALQDKPGMANRLSNIGNVFGDQGDYEKAVAYYTRALKIDRELKNNEGIAIDIGNIGQVYLNQGDYAKALSHLFNALKIAEKIKFNTGIATNLGNIGIVYQNQGNYQKAMAYYLKALELAEEMEDKRNIARHLGNIGTVYYNQENYTKALEFYFKAQQMKEKIGNIRGMSADLGNIGIIYMEQGDSAAKKGNKAFALTHKYPHAMTYYLKALKIKKEFNDKHGIASVLTNLGSLYMKTGNLSESEANLKKALLLAKEIKAEDLIKYVEESLSELYNRMGRYDEALEHYRNFIAARDSITNVENTKKQTRMEMQYAFDKKQAADSIRTLVNNRQEKLKQVQEIQQQKIYTYGGIIGFLLMAVVTAISFRAYKQKQKANQLIAEKKQQVEVKQKEILDSIHYAKRIQRALLPSEKYILRILKRS